MNTAIRSGIILQCMITQNVLFTVIYATYANKNRNERHYLKHWYMLYSESKVTKLDILLLLLALQVIKSLVVIWILTIYHGDLLFFLLFQNRHRLCKYTGRGQHRQASYFSHQADTWPSWWSCTLVGRLGLNWPGLRKMVIRCRKQWQVLTVWLWLFLSLHLQCLVSW